MTSYGYTIDLLEFQAHSLERILKRVIIESDDSAEKILEAAVAQEIIEQLRECKRNFR